MSISNLYNLYPPMRGIANLPWYALLGEIKVVNEAALSGTSLTASASAHTKGSYSELLASASGDANLLAMMITGVNVSGEDTSTLMDIATGDAGSEIDRAPNIAIGGAGTASALQTAGIYLYLPIRIAAGQRVAARIQALRTAPQTANVRWSLLRVGALHMVPESVDVLGTSTATSGGTAMSGASGSYVQVVASTARDYRAVCIIPCQGVGATVVSNASVLYTMGVGEAGSEIDTGSVFFRSSSLETIGVFNVVPPMPIARYIPAGSRLSVKHEIASNPQNYGVCLIGVP
jgi:hypothetical protein